MALIKLPIAFTALQLGEVSLQAATSENVFYQGTVYGRENWTDDYSMGVDQGGGNIRAGRYLAGYAIADISESGNLDELKSLITLNDGPIPFTQLHPSLLVERQHLMPVDIDVRGNTTIQAQFTDTVTASHYMQYAVNIYIEYEELD